MKTISVTILLIITVLQLRGQTNFCEFGSNKGGTCGFYKDFELTEPVDQVGDAIILNKQNPYAYKSYEGTPYTTLVFTVTATEEAQSRMFWDVELQIVNENDEMVFSQMCAVDPAPGEIMEQPVYLNGGKLFRLIYRGDVDGQDLRFVKVEEKTEDE